MKEQGSSLTEVERHEMRSRIGQVNWLCGISRPDIGYYVCAASTSLPTGTVQDIISMNKLIRYIKSTPTHIHIPKMKNLESLYLIVFADASMGNLPCKGSQGGQVVFLTDGQNVCPISWHSKKIRRVVKSTLAAETLALLDGCENALMISSLVGEVIYGANKSGRAVPVTAYTDNKNLSETAHTTHNLSEKLLEVDMAIVREMIASKKIELKWVNTDEQLGNALTKRGASAGRLLEVLMRGRL